MYDEYTPLGSRNASTDDGPVELAFALDDAITPTELTAYPRDDVDTTTAWISIAVEDVVDLREHA